MTRKIESKYDAVVVGSGIGGLLSAAYLARKGYSTCVLEGLSFYGGKFTGFDYKGFQVPSGAFHLIPGGAAGNFGKCFAELGLDIEYRIPKSALVVLEGGKRYKLHTNPLLMFAPQSYVHRFSFKETVSLMAIMYYLFRPNVELPDISFGDFLMLFSKSPRIKKFVDQFMIFANGTDVDLSSLIEFNQSVRTAKYRKGELVVGGCRHLTEELVRAVKRSGGTLVNKTRVSRINVSGDRITGVDLADGTTVEADLVVTNAGPKMTRKLLGKHTPKWFIQKQENFLPANAIAFSVATDEPLLDHDTIEAPMDHNSICGYVQISNLDSSLAPPGKHYLLAAQMITDSTANITNEIEGGIRDLLDIFPQMRRQDIICTSTFHRDWGGCPTGQRMGQSGPNRYPVKIDPFSNLYMVSHDSQGWGFAGDIIGDAASQLNRMVPPKT
ncbi:MAG: NAD(P)/FAD-dependent oxidoreductase [Deltaproteobacteria bacterium]|nr:NAD(P)/FAD-dependent oxidoreductase [Deltaproteobacteria bacterium]